MARTVSESDAPAATDGRHGGTDGNERLTGSTGALLVVLLAAEGLTVISLRAFLSWHIFLGIVLIPPVLLKLASTGYRFTRYYTGSAPYVRKGPPPLYLRALGPVIVLAAVVLFSTGVALIVIGPGGGGLRGVHKLSFIVLFLAMGVHVLAHIRKIPGLTAADWRKRTRLAGGAGRRALLLVSLLAGVAFGAVAIAHDGAWIHRAHHHRFEDGGR